MIQNTAKSRGGWARFLPGIGTIVLAALMVAVFPVLPGHAASELILKGAGATFPHPLYNKWIEEYQRQTGARVSYQAVGSGQGIRELLAYHVDFGATDAFLSDEELNEAAPFRILHIPTCIGAVVVIYHLPENPNLRLTPDTLADIFLGRITRWSSSRIAEHNPGVTLPAQDITVVHRSDESGTTFLFTDYLSKVSPDWDARVGHGQSVRWPVGYGVDGNPRVAEFVSRIPGGIGFVEMAHAIHTGLPFASLRNQSGIFVHPSTDSVTAAADVGIPADARVLFTNTSADGGYPISAFTYLIVYQDQSQDNRPLQQAESLSRFLQWTVTKGQRFNESLCYAPLTQPARTTAEAIIQSLRYEGSPLRN